MEIGMLPAPTPLLRQDPLEVATDQVIAACDGDVRAAVCALIVAKGLLEAELNDVYASGLKARGQVRRSERG
jgi:hypothetical protein